MRFFKQAARFGSAVALGAAGAAHAAVPGGVIEAITEAGTDAGTIGAAILVVMIGILAFRLMRRAAH